MHCAVARLTANWSWHPLKVCIHVVNLVAVINNAHSLEALPYLLHTPKLPAYLESLSSRLLLSLLIAIPKLSWVSVSRDPTLKDAILREVKNSCLELTVSSSSILSKSVPLVIEAISDVSKASCSLTSMLR